MWAPTRARCWAIQEWTSTYLRTKDTTKPLTPNPMPQISRIATDWATTANSSHKPTASSGLKQHPKESTWTLPPLSNRTSCMISSLRVVLTRWTRNFKVVQLDTTLPIPTWGRVLRCKALKSRITSCLKDCSQSWVSQWGKRIQFKHLTDLLNAFLTLLSSWATNTTKG